MSRITLNDISLKDYEAAPRVSYLKDVYFRAMPEICIERPRLITEFHREKKTFEKKRISILDKAGAYRYVLEKRTPIVCHTQGYEKGGNGMKPFEIKDVSLFAGSTTSKFKGVPLYPEFLALSLWPELWTISRRASNPFHITDSEVEELNYNIFPYWVENTIMELGRKRCLDETSKKGLQLLQNLVFFMVSKPNCISHTIPDFSRAIKVGLRGIIDEAKDRRDRTDDASKKEFYTAITEVLEGVITYSRRLADKAEELASNKNDPVLKKELLDIAEINRRVPEFPARTFREGLTTVWVSWTAIHIENPNVGLSLGRLDQILYDLYRQDIEKNAINIQDAIELICCMWLKIGDHVPTIADAGEQLFGGTGSNQSITLGGVDRNGKDAVNDLTYVMLKATELMRLRDPNPNARYYPGVNSREYLKRLCEININTGAIPAIHNDKAIIKALTTKGEAIEHARDYGVIGCIEPGSNGRFYGHTAAILLNLTSALELTLFNGKHRHTGLNKLISKETGDPTTFKTFDEFKAAFEEQTRWLVEQATTLNNIFGKTHQDFYPTPTLSAFFEGPMEKGKDLIQGGATINSSGAAIIGLADVADSLSAIEEVVFNGKNGKTISFAQILDAINNKNFEGYEALQKRLMNPGKTPKYGNENPEADGNVIWLVKLLDRLFGEKTNYRGGRYRVGYWTMTMHAGFGRLMKALPSGRKDRENFTSGITPVSGVTPCLTRTLNSVASLPSEALSGGVALNMKYTPENGMLDRFVTYVEGYFDDKDEERDGGMEIQFIITTHEELAKVAENPDKNPELLVRVSGYTAYFKDLNPQMQKEIIDRTEYILSSGKMSPFEPFPLPKKRR